MCAASEAPTPSVDEEPMASITNFLPERIARAVFSREELNDLGTRMKALEAELED